MSAPPPAPAVETRVTPAAPQPEPAAASNVAAGSDSKAPALERTEAVLPPEGTPAASAEWKTPAPRTVARLPLKPPAKQAAAPTAAAPVAAPAAAPAVVPAAAPPVVPPALAAPAHPSAPAAGQALAALSNHTPAAALPKPAQPVLISAARSARDYRIDGARHIYRSVPERIFAGKLPRLLLAVGVINIEIDARGAVTGIQWARAPRSSPRVVDEIERLVRAAAPYPAPVHMGSVTYTDTWLWDKSGRFQLDTLTQGQD